MKKEKKPKPSEPENSITFKSKETHKIPVANVVQMKTNPKTKNPSTKAPKNCSVISPTLNPHEKFKPISHFKSSLEDECLAQKGQSKFLLEKGFGSQKDAKTGPQRNKKKPKASLK